MIRQAISCDICGAEKKQTNHWFVVCEQGGELRVSGWGSRNRLRAGSKHLCGQTCLHKLLDDFLARTIEGRPAESRSGEGRLVAEAVALGTGLREATDASLMSGAAFDEEESSARLLTPLETPAALAVVAAMPLPLAETPRPMVLPARMDENSADAARRRRAEAWERERARELRVMERRAN